MRALRRERLVMFLPLLREARRLGSDRMAGGRWSFQRRRLCQARREGKSGRRAFWRSRKGCRAISSPSEKIWPRRWPIASRRSCFRCLKTTKAARSCRKPARRQNSTCCRKGRRGCGAGSSKPFTLPRKIEISLAQWKFARDFQSHSVRPELCRRVRESVATRCKGLTILGGSGAGRISP